MNAENTNLFSLPGATTGRLSICPFFTDALFVKLSVLQLPLSQSVETPTVTTNDSHVEEIHTTNTASTIQTVVVLPREWAGYDIGTITIYSDL